jgi:hypothetical protein
MNDTALLGSFAMSKQEIFCHAYFVCNSSNNRKHFLLFS